MSNMHTYNYVDIMIKETTKATEISQLPFVKMLYVMFVVWLGDWRTKNICSNYDDKQYDYDFITYIYAIDISVLIYSIS